MSLVADGRVMSRARTVRPVSETTLRLCDCSVGMECRQEKRIVEANQNEGSGVGRIGWR